MFIKFNKMNIMSKKDYLELLIKSYGLIPSQVEHYRTSTSDGQYAIGVGWKGKGLDKNGISIINFYEPDGFTMALYMKYCVKRKIRI